MLGDIKIVASHAQPSWAKINDYKKTDLLTTVLKSMTVLILNVWMAEIMTLHACINGEQT